MLLNMLTLNVLMRPIFHGVSSLERGLSHSLQQPHFAVLGWMTFPKLFPPFIINLLFFFLYIKNHHISYRIYWTYPTLLVRTELRLNEDCIFLHNEHVHLTFHCSLYTVLCSLMRIVH